VHGLHTKVPLLFRFRSHEAFLSYPPALASVRLAAMHCAGASALRRRFARGAAQLTAELPSGLGLIWRRIGQKDGPNHRQADVTKVADG